jgi:hydroxymethylbilane synthase
MKLMKRLLRVGSRESKLAVSQARLVMDMIKKHHPELELELVTMKTSGDMILDRSLDEVGGKGLFVKELDIALRSGVIDFAVHSLKDMPMETPEELPVVSYARRENPRDALVLPLGAAALDLSRPFGCSSARRRLQLETLYPGVKVEGLRGNVLTRLEKLDRGGLCATVLACAGLTRLSLGGRISRVFGEDEMIPAAGQGVLAVQARAGEDHAYLACVDDREARIAASCEKAFVRRLGGSCSSPIAAYASFSGPELVLRGLYYDEKRGRQAKGKLAMPAGEAEKLGIALAEALMKETESRAAGEVTG